MLNPIEIGRVGKAVVEGVEDASGAFMSEVAKSSKSELSRIHDILAKHCLPGDPDLFGNFDIIQLHEK